MINKRNLLVSAVCGEIASWFLIFIVRNPNIEELKGLPPVGEWAWILVLALPLVFVIGLYIAYSLSKFIKVLKQLIKYAEVGVLNTFIDLGVLSLLMTISGIGGGWLYPVFKGISFLTATTNSYFWNKIWTFQKKKFIQPGKEFTKFLMVSGIGLGINVGSASIVVNAIGPQFGISVHLWGIIGAVVAAFCGMAWNFLGYKFIVFKK